MYRRITWTNTIKHSNHTTTSIYYIYIYIYLPPISHLWTVTDYHACMLSPSVILTLQPNGELGCNSIAHQASLSMEFSRQEYQSGLPFPPPGHLPNLGIKLKSLPSPAQAGGFFTTVPPGKSINDYQCTTKMKIKIHIVTITLYFTL